MLGKRLKTPPLTEILLFYEIFVCLFIFFIVCNDGSSRKAWLWFFFSPFLFPPRKRGNKKGEWIVILSHAFLLDRNDVVRDFVIKIKICIIEVYYLKYYFKSIKYYGVLRNVWSMPQCHNFMRNLCDAA